MNVLTANRVALAAVLSLLVAVFGLAGVAYADDETTAPLQAGAIADEAIDTTAGETDAEAAEAADPADPADEPGDPGQVKKPLHANGWFKVNGNWQYWKKHKLVKNGWVVTSKAPRIKNIPEGYHRYWIDRKGNLARGRLVNPDRRLDSNARYYAYATKRGYVATTGKLRVGDDIYLVKNDKGKLETGNEQGFLSTSKYDNGTRHRYYINPRTHAITTGKPVKVKDFGWVYAYPKKGYLLTGLTRVDSRHLVLAGKSGKLFNRAGWLETGDYTRGSVQRYRIEPTNANKNLLGARTGVFALNGRVYEATSQGYLIRNTSKLVNRSYYEYNSKGVRTKNDVVTRMYRLAQGYWSPSRYLLMVDIDNPKTIVFEGSKGNWKPKYVWNCCTGAPSTPTVEGTFSVGIKGWSFGEGNGFSCYYYTQISGDYLFHTRLYYANTWTLMEKDNFGNRHSHGCVHLHEENARWIWDNVPSGTTIACIR